jgi:hypothetical protein
MFIYNVTTKVDWSIHDAWVKWMQEIHIPEVMAAECFENVQFVRLLEIDEEDGPTYAAQFTAPSKAMYNRYIEKHAPSLREKANAEWGNKYISFRTLMQIVN